MKARKAKIAGTGHYVPKRRVTDTEMDELLGMASGWVRQKTNVATRYFIEDETASHMGAAAAYSALAAAGLSFADMDCLVCASGTMEQPIPCTAALIQRAMGQEASGVPAFDINATCLSFVAALDMMSCLIDAGRYRRVLLVSTEIASKGLNWEQKESAALFGDGAAAAVLTAAAMDEPSAVLAAAMETYSEGAHLSEIRGGGSALPSVEYVPERRVHYAFDMQGEALFRLAYRKLPAFTARLLAEAGTRIEDVKLVIPHQGSVMAMRLLRRKLGISEEQLVSVAERYGNTIAASIPMALHAAVAQNRLTRGDRVMLLGTSAGMSLGGVVLDY